MKAPQLDPKFWQRFEKLVPFLVFVFALAIRLYYDLVKSEQRLCSFGDGYFFLKTGQELAKAITSAGNLDAFLSNLTVHTSEVAGGVATFGSGALGDRLLLDGPIYTLFLAIVHMLGGIVNTTDYANNSTIFSIANSFVDALSCVLIFICGRLAFGSKAGLIAAFLLAVYPASVLNTRLCYSELFTYFLLLLWSTIAIGLYRASASSRQLVNSARAFMLGATSVLILLARSFFFPLPVAALIILFGASTKDDLGASAESAGANAAGEPASGEARTRQGWLTESLRRLFSNAPSLLALVAGAAIVLAPWLWFTHEVTGKYTPWVNRAPGYNLFVGNQLNTDGWRTWPAQPGIPNETSYALTSISRNFASDPIQYAALLLRKVSRLWAGVWNDFQHKFFGIGWQAQNVFHDLILMLSVFGFIAALRAPCRVRRPALIFAFFAAYHSLYACFEPVARYAITAMPFACLLAGYALTAIANPLRNRKFLRLAVFSIFFFALLDTHFSFIPLLFSVLPTDMLTPIALVDAALWIGGWLLLGSLATRAMADSKRWQAATVWIVVSIFAVVTVANLRYDPARSEWFTELKNDGDAVHADFRLTPYNGAPPPISYLLVDMQTTMPSPLVTVLVNDKPTAPPIPVLQLMADRTDASEIFALQAQAMTVDPRSYRHWWVFPLPTRYLSFSSPNKISIAAKVDANLEYRAVKVFGSYPSTNEELMAIREDLTNNGNTSPTLPSINKFSWVKGFVTIDRRDQRPYEKLVVKGSVRNCTFQEKTGSNSSDLSSSLGRQFGAFRMRLYVPPNETPGFNIDGWSADSTVLFQKADEVLVAGGDPSTMTMNPAPISVPDRTPSSFYLLSCQLQRTKQRTIGGVTVSFTGAKPASPSDATSKEKGAVPTELKWTSPWSPTAMKLEGDGWQRFTFVERIPDDVRTAGNVTATIMVAPFAADRLFLHRKEALRDTVKVRNVELRYFRQLAPKLSPVNEDYLY